VTRGKKGGGGEKVDRSAPLFHEQASSVEIAVSRRCFYLGNRDARIRDYAGYPPLLGVCCYTKCKIIDAQLIVGLYKCD